jgi:NAD(P)H-nitrite reductase large subunit
MARTRHVIVGGGTAGINAITTIRQYDHGASEIILVSTERPYARMVLPYYLKGSISEAHVYTANPTRLRMLDVEAYLGRRAVQLDTQANSLTLDDDTVIPYDDILSHGAQLSVVEIAPQILPRMIDPQGAQVVEQWLRDRGVMIRTNARLQAIEDAGQQKRLRFDGSEDILADLVIMATGIRTNLDWLNGSGITINRGIVVDAQQRSNVPNVYAAGDVAEGKDLMTGQLALHAIEPTAMEHGRIAGANMAGQPLAYRGSLLMNIVEVLGLEIASFGAWDSTTAEVLSATKPERPAYRKLLWQDDRVIGAMLLGPEQDVWTTNDVGMLKGLVQSGVHLGDWKGYLRHNLFDIKRAFIASGTTARLLPQTVLGSPSVPAGAVAVSV